MRSFKLIPLLFSLLISLVFSSNANHLQEPDFDVHQYEINLTTDYPNQSIQGFARITFISHINNLGSIELSLLDFQIDSVLHDHQALSYQYNDTSIKVTLSKKLSEGDTSHVTIKYHGKPAQDPSGWGGFYFRSDVAFNLGVGFAAKPHNYGRAWFPCVDNFTDRAFYDFAITTPPNKKAFCNGEFMGVDTNMDNSKTWYWEMNQSIPTYLASMAVGPYATVKQMHQGVNGTFPIIYAVKPGDSTTMKKGFENIHKALEVFEEFYGPHQFHRVGFVSVPFNGGAMEHATNIAFPSTSLGKTISNQRLWAHELSHHWWGDLVTCHRAEEMWINEGWASFSEFLFLEKVYGKDDYRQAVRANHYNVLKNAHKSDNGYRPLVPVPHRFTYGDHSYNKGADVVHTLRSYLGDSLFKEGISRFMQENSFQAVSSKGLRDSLSNYTGINLTPFFNNWVFNPGFPHFEIQELEITPDGSHFDVSGIIKQKLHEAPELYEAVPLAISAFNSNWDTVNYRVKASGSETPFEFSLPFDPIFLGLDMKSKISDGKTTQLNRITRKKEYNFDRTELSLDVNNLQDSALVLIEHNWANPEYFKERNPGIRLSDLRYWSVDGYFPDEFEAKATIRYNENQYPDDLDLKNKDSFLLLYRPNTEVDWREYGNYTKNLINTTHGIVEINDLKPGQYCFGVQDHSVVGLKEPAKEKGKSLKIFPNPGKKQIKVVNPYEDGVFSGLRIYDLKGTMIKSINPGNSDTVTFTTVGIKPGTYILEAQFRKRSTLTEKFVLEE